MKKVNLVEDAKLRAADKLAALKGEKKSLTSKDFQDVSDEVFSEFNIRLTPTAVERILISVSVFGDVDRRFKNGNYAKLSKVEKAYLNRKVEESVSKKYVNGYKSSFTVDEACSIIKKVINSPKTPVIEVLGNFKCRRTNYYRWIYELNTKGSILGKTVLTFGDGHGKADVLEAIRSTRDKKFYNSLTTGEKLRFKLILGVIQQWAD